MSYDIYLRGATEACPTCGHVPSDPGYLPSPTYNLTEIFDLALTDEALPNPEVSEGSVVILGVQTSRPRGLRLLSGKKAIDTQVMLQTALERLLDPTREESFRALEPSNKWGTLDSAVEVIRMLIKLAHEYPQHVWEIR